MRTVECLSFDLLVVFGFTQSSFDACLLPKSRVGSFAMSLFSDVYSIMEMITDVWSRLMFP